MLRGGDRGYLALVEHDSAATFAQMHASPAAKEVQQRLHQVLEEGPQAEVYEVVEDATVGDCCGGHPGMAADGNAAAGSPSRDDAVLAPHEGGTFAS